MEVALYSSKYLPPLDSADGLIPFFIDKTKIKQEILSLPTSLEL